MIDTNILLICGGGGTEHEVSLISASYIEKNLHLMPGINTHRITIEKDGSRTYRDGKKCELRRGGEIFVDEKIIYLNYAIPCIHGSPGEDGAIQSVFEMMKLPYLGSGPQASLLCFDKVTTKMWLTSLEIPNTPYIFSLSHDSSRRKEIENFTDKHGTVFVKASTQGSSVGCYKVTQTSEVWGAFQKASELARTVLIEQAVKGRELEVSVYENPELSVSDPGEIICKGDFYSYEEKYSDTSSTTTETKAQNISSENISKIKDYAKKAFIGLGCKDLARIDFFLSEDGQIYLNEPNTFPGMTPISMFPKMMEEMGVSFKEFLENRISTYKR